MRYRCYKSKWLLEFTDARRQQLWYIRNGIILESIDDFSQWKVDEIFLDTFRDANAWKSVVNMRSKSSRTGEWHPCSSLWVIAVFFPHCKIKSPLIVIDNLYYPCQNCHFLSTNTCFFLQVGFCKLPFWNVNLWNALKSWLMCSLHPNLPPPFLRTLAHCLSLWWCLDRCYCAPSTYLLY